MYAMEHGIGTHLHTQVTNVYTAIQLTPVEDAYRIFEGGDHPIIFGRTNNPHPLTIEEVDLGSDAGRLPLYLYSPQPKYFIQK